MGPNSSRAFRTASILLNCDKGYYSNNNGIENEEICRVLKIGKRTIDRVNRKCIEEGFEGVLERRPSSQNYTKTIDGDIEANWSIFVGSNRLKVPKSGH